MRSIAGLSAICFAAALGTTTIDAQSSGLTLVPVGSVRLEEGDANFIGSISGIASSGAGRFYVSDKGNSVVHEFAADGRQLRTFPVHQNVVQPDVG